MKNVKIILSGLLVVAIILGISFNFLNKENKIIESKNIELKKSSNILSMMYETEKGIYETSKDNRWPQDGYTFNEHLSKCENGGKLIWDNENNKVLLSTNISDKCYVYFSKNGLSKISDVCTENEKFNSCINLLYYNGGENLYLHNTDLENGAEDNSIRYAGANPDNYVCFGYNDSTGTYENGWCPADNLYRVIGIFGHNNHGTSNSNLVKLIKADYATKELLGENGGYNPDANTYSWGSSNGTNYTWDKSLLNTVNLNYNYLERVNATWGGMIVPVNWHINDIAYDDITNVIPKDAYKKEVLTPINDATWSGQVGLMYVSDYGFAASPEYWGTNLSSYSDDVIKKNNWLYIENTDNCFTGEMTIVSSDIEYVEYALTIDCAGSIASTTKEYIGTATITLGASVRPAFYLNDNVTYKSGSGTKLDPIRIA